MGIPPGNRSIYLSDIPLEEAQASWRRALDGVGQWAPLEREEIALTEALGRITTEPVFAMISSPHYHAAAMDGYTLRAVATGHATDRTPVTLHLDTEAEYVDTGDPLPAWSDAVVPIEDVEPIGRTDE